MCAENEKKKSYTGLKKKNEKKKSYTGAARLYLPTTTSTERSTVTLQKKMKYFWQN